MTTADDLRASAQYMREHGKAEGTAEADDGSVCAVGAIAHGLGYPVNICYGETDWISLKQYDRFNHVVRALGDYLLDINARTVYVSVARWSDTSEADDVITGMEKAAAWIEEQA